MKLFTQKYRVPVFLAAAAAILTALATAFFHTKRPAPETPEARDARLIEFIKTEPMGKPDSCLQMIRAYARNPSELSGLCENLMYRADDVLSAERIQLLLNDMDKIFRNKNDTMLAKISMRRGASFRNAGRFDTALICLKKSLAFFESARLPDKASEACQQISRTYVAKSNFVAATEYSVKSLEIIQAQPQELYWRDRLYALTSIGSVYNKQRNFQKGKAAFAAAVQIATEHQQTDDLKNVGYSLALCYAFTGRPDTAVVMALKGLEDVRREGPASLIPSYEAALGESYRLKGEYGQSIEYAKAALSGFDSIRYRDRAAQVSANIGDAYFLLGDLAPAETWYKKTLERLDSVPRPYLKSAVQDSLARVYLEKNEAGPARRLLRDAKIASDSILNTEKQQIIETLNLKYETAQREERIKELQNARRTARLQSLLVSALLALALVFIIYLTDRFRKKRALLIQENLLIAAREENARAALEQGRRLLDVFEKNLRSKEQIIGELETQLELIAPTNGQAATESEALKLDWVNKMLLTEADWLEYLQYFERAYPGFIHRVETAYPDLTKGDTRLLLLIRQGFKPIEIERILGMKLEGYRKARYRLRKRMAVQEDDKLNETIRGFQ